MIFELMREMTDEEEKVYKKSLKKDSKRTGITLWKTDVFKTIDLYQEKEEKEKDFQENFE